ncbi:cystathionine beta-synthase-like protein [Pollicipes pollicipes]|uniref:cystathionine beta-synthase-like protein n=1 Tax=Pollicipes pollicipes TaxID=41117 RepID=UPI001884C985|nr:cystathionine beta-synthase-like protein [Pollicipes pollicipes]
MSPVSCLSRVPSTERQKKRVRFCEDVSSSTELADSAMTSPAHSDDLLRSLTPASMCAETPISAPDPTHPLTPIDAQPERWGFSSSPRTPWTEPCLPATCAGSAASPWPAWWSHKVSLLGVTAPLTVLPSVPCQDAVHIMHQQGFDQLPVVDQLGDVMGIVTLGSLMVALVIQRVQPSSPVGQVMYRDFHTVTRDETLGNLSGILERSHFALIVHCQRRLTANREVATKEMVIGIVTQIDLLSHITSNSLSV